MMGVIIFVLFSFIHRTAFFAALPRCITIFFADLKDRDIMLMSSVQATIWLDLQRRVPLKSIGGFCMTSQFFLEFANYFAAIYIDFTSNFFVRTLCTSETGILSVILTLQLATFFVNRTNQSLVTRAAFTRDSKCCGSDCRWYFWYISCFLQ